MSRETKYRVWDKQNQCWSVDELYIDADGDLYEIYEASRAYQTYMHKERVNERYEVIWYTGLKGKNGTEIYEDDVVKGRHYMNGEWHRIIGQVVFVGPRFCIDGVGKYEHIMRVSLDSSYEVIGNIREDANLIRKEGE